MMRFNLSKVCRHLFGGLRSKVTVLLVELLAQVGDVDRIELNRWLVITALGQRWVVDLAFRREGEDAE